MNITTQKRKLAECSLMSEQLVERGHFQGKTGNHINGRLSKHRLFSDQEFFETLLAPLPALVAEFEPTLLVAEQTSAATIARWLGGRMSVNVITPAKDATTIDLSVADTSHTLILEDNIITGASIDRIKALLLAQHVTPVGVVSIFDSNNANTARQIRPAPKVLYPLDIVSWHPSGCVLCYAYGTQTLGCEEME